MELVKAPEKDNFQGSKTQEPIEFGMHIWILNITSQGVLSPQLQLPTLETTMYAVHLHCNVLLVYFVQGL